MRNGNRAVTDDDMKLESTFYPTYEEWKRIIDSLNIFAPSIFLSYLWGMETFFIKEVKKKNESLFILPMRNGNFHRHMMYMRLNFGFLSYLWGMETRRKMFISFLVQTFYPTYEEWKLFSAPILEVFSFTFYPTYEEWKLINFLSPLSYNVFLFILPMRDGN